MATRASTWRSVPNVTSQSTTEAEPGAEAPAAAETPAADGPPAIPHPVDGRENCLLCHGEDAFMPYPANHVGRPVTSCQTCHQIGEAEVAPATAPAAPAVEATPQATVVPATEASAIPHSIEGQENQCLACHYTGSIEPFPSNHEGFTNQMCLSCHSLED
jgi:nitrate reductase cytochrome c-type subunit